MHISTMRPPHRAPRPCTLLSLPRELRDRIYDFALVEAPYALISDKLSRKQAAQPPLTRTCHQIRAESLFVFYEKNTFHFSLRDRPRRLERFVIMQHLHRLKKIELAFCPWHPSAVFRLEMEKGQRTMMRARLEIVGERCEEAEARLDWGRYILGALIPYGRDAMPGPLTLERLEMLLGVIWPRRWSKKEKRTEAVYETLEDGKDAIRMLFWRARLAKRKIGKFLTGRRESKEPIEVTASTEIEGAEARSSEESTSSMSEEDSESTAAERDAARWRQMYAALDRIL